MNTKHIGFSKTIGIVLTALMGLTSQAASPTIDAFNMQSYIRLTNGNPTSATSGTFVFGVFKGSTCIWAKRIAAVSISTGIINQNLTGTGSNIASISNVSATPGECVGNFTAVTLNSTLLNAGASAALNLRVYSETSLDGFQPIWDVAFTSVPTAMIADTANSATNATTANDLAAGIKVSTSAGAGSVGKFPILDGTGKLDNSFINQTGLTIASTQVTGLGTAATVNTGSAAGNIGLLGAGGVFPSTMMATYTANRVMSTNGSGVMSGGFQTTTTSAGAGDIGKIPLLNSNGKIDSTAIDSTALTPDPANLTSAVPVNKGGTGNTTLTTNHLLVGNGTSAVTFLAPTNGNVIYGATGTWSSGTPDTAGLVDKTSAQTIGGAKTWSGAQVANGNVNFNGNMTLGNGGSTYVKVLTCTIASGAMTSGTAKTNTCTGATTGSVVFCSPTVQPTTAWVVSAARISAANTLQVVANRYTGAVAWTTAFNCVVFVP